MWIHIDEKDCWEEGKTERWQKLGEREALGWVPYWFPRKKAVLSPGKNQVIDTGVRSATARDTFEVPIEQARFYKPN